MARPAALAAVLAFLVWPGAALSQGGSSAPPRNVGGAGVSVVRGAASTETKPPAQPEAPAPAVAPAPEPPKTASSAALEALERRDAFIRRSVMQSICRGC